MNQSCTILQIRTGPRSLARRRLSSACRAGRGRASRRRSPSRSRSWWGCWSCGPRSRSRTAWSDRKHGIDYLCLVTVTLYSTHQKCADGLHQPDDHVVGESDHVPLPPSQDFLLLKLSRPGKLLKLPPDKDSDVAEWNRENVAAVEKPQQPPDLRW